MHFVPRCEPPETLTSPVRRDLTGQDGPTRAAVAGAGWRTTSHGLHVPSEVDQTVEQRIAEAAARLPEGGMLTGWAVLRLAGAAYFDGSGPGGARRPIPVFLGHHARIRSAGVLVERTRREMPEPTYLCGLPCAPAEMALIHELRRARSWYAAGICVDMALAAGVVDLAVARAVAGDSWRLPPQAGYALERACPHCRSPKESEMLQVWEHAAGFPRPMMNQAILDRDGRRIAVVDLLCPASGTYGEYNGAAHRDVERQRRDEERADELRGVGLEGFVLVGADTHQTWVRRMQTARSRALWLPAERRRWQLGGTVLG